MKTQVIGYGRSVIPCEFMDSQSCREDFYKEVRLEDWEDEAESFELLRSQVNAELGINEDVKKLREEKRALLAELKILNESVAEARGQWAKVQAFLLKVELVDEDSIPF
jgi:hypothetical protein